MITPNDSKRLRRQVDHHILVVLAHSLTEHAHATAHPPIQVPPTKKDSQ